MRCPFYIIRSNGLQLKLQIIINITYLHVSYKPREPGVSAWFCIIRHEIKQRESGQGAKTILELLSKCMKYNG
jgi:hypothetical protein